MQTLFCQGPLLLAYLLSTPLELMPNGPASAARGLLRVGCMRGLRLSKNPKI
jgi:hypothetical protein